MDGVVYGAAASLGFATFENIIYVHAGGFWTALVRAFSAVPAHACDGALMGYCVGQARFNPERKRASWLGLFVAIIFHGFYDYGTKFFSRHAAILNRYYLKLPG